MFKHVPINLPDLSVNDGSRFRTYQTPEGKSYPSITTVLSILDDGGLDKWRDAIGHEAADKIGRQAATRGTRVHQYLEDYVNNKEVVLDVFNKASVSKCMNLLDENLGEVYGQEIAVYSDKLQIAGRLDLLAKWCGTPSIIDFKTATKPKRPEWIENYFLQAAFYACAIYEQTGMIIKQSVILIAVDMHEPQIFVRPTFHYIEKLMNARKLFKETHGL